MSKLVTWFLLMIVSVVLVAWVSPPRAPGDARRVGDEGMQAASDRVRLGP